MVRMKSNNYVLYDCEVYLYGKGNVVRWSAYFIFWRCDGNSYEE